MVNRDSRIFALQCRRGNADFDKLYPVLRYNQRVCDERPIKELP